MFTRSRKDRITLHIPKFFNDGFAVPEDFFVSYERDMYHISSSGNVAEKGEDAGGWTQIDNAIGGWHNAPGIEFREPVRLYFIDVADAEVVLRDVVALVNRIKAELAQEDVYTTLTEVEVLTLPAIQFDTNTGTGVVPAA